MKIKVNLNESVYNKLIEDIKLFKISKSDKSINKNKFLNLLIRNFYSDFEKNLDKSIKNINDVIDDIEKSKEIAFRLKNNISDSKNNYYNKSITFIPDEDNRLIFKDIHSNQNYISDSAYVRNMIIEYLTYPQYKREEIIYNDSVEKILSSIKNKNVIYFTINDENIIFKPYKLGTSKEEVYSYLIGKKDNGEIKSYNIYKIKEIIIKKDRFEFSEEETKLFDEIIKNGIQFAYQSPYKVNIVLTSRGIKLFEKRYVNRPIPISIDGNKYSFSCSYDQLKSYFLAFGREAYIKGKRLRDDINEEYLKAIEMYNKNNKKVL